MHRLAWLAVVLSTLAFAEEKPLTLGVAQPYGAEHATKLPAAVEPYLTKQLRGPVKVVVHASVDELAEALAAGKVDLAWITPLAFVRASQKNSGVVALTKAMRKQSLFYRAAFIVKKDSPLKSLAELKGKKVAWVDKSSTSGFLFSRELLKKDGLSPEGFFGEETFAGDHPSVCKAVREGRADVGATFADEAPAGKDVVASGCTDAPPVTDFRVLASTGNVPNEVIAVRDFFPPTRVNDVIKAFGRMGLDAEGKKLLADAFRVDGWVMAVEGDFAPVVEVLRATDAKPKVAPAQQAGDAKPAGKKPGK